MDRTLRTIFEATICLLDKLNNINMQNTHFKIFPPGEMSNCITVFVKCYDVVKKKKKKKKKKTTSRAQLFKKLSIIFGLMFYNLVNDGFNASEYLML